jgi:small subunit ribosomal protein S16
MSEPSRRSIFNKPDSAVYRNRRFPFGAGLSRRTEMSAAIRLKRFGTKKRPYYRIVVMDKRAARDGKTIEELGYYHPIEAEGRQVHFDADRVRTWVTNGACVSDTVRGILNKHHFSL